MSGTIEVFVLHLFLAEDRSKINKQGCGLARKGHGNGVYVKFFSRFRIIFFTLEWILIFFYFGMKVYYNLL